MRVQIIPMHLQDAVGRQRPLTDLSRQELSLCLDVLARIVHSNESVEILRPDEHQISMEKIRAFRQAQYRCIAPYLLSPFQEEIEEGLRLDQRSLHFVAVHGERIVGALRATDPPFELSALSPELHELTSQFRGYKEISRLVVDPEWSGAFVGEKLLLGTGRWLLAKTDVQGFVLICRENRRRYFEHYGLRPVTEGPYRIPERSNRLYYVMAITLPGFLDRIFSAIYQQPTEIEKRYRWTHKKV